MKWSDGSLQILIGADSYDLNEQDISNENDILFAKQKSGLQSQGVVQSKFSIKPPIKMQQTKERKIKLVFRQRELHQFQLHQTV